MNAALVRLDVEAPRPAALGPFASAVPDLIGRFGDDRRDAARAKQSPVATRGVRLIAQHRVGPGPRASRAEARHPNRIEQVRKHGRVVRLTGPRSSTSGRPLPSQRWWILVLSPPRERPTACSAGSRSSFL